jgi:broad specificity phosphatase PhoE
VGDATRHEVWLARHGETEWSAAGRHTGRTDVPLTADGERQASELGRRIGSRRFALVLTSPLARARETCRLAGQGAAAQEDDDLVEWDYGSFEGRTTAEIRRELPGWSVWDGALPDGETAEQVGERADRVIARARAAEGDVALFGHAHALRVLASRWLGLPARQGRGFALDTASLSVLGFEREEPVIRSWNWSGRLDLLS